MQNKIILGVVVLSAVILSVSTISFAADDPSKDPFYTQGRSVAAPAVNSVYEQVDPFSGILSLIHTDLHLPGNGGLDLNLVRTYNSMIWGRRDTSHPALVASNDRSPLGIGWTLHMGIVRNPTGDGSKQFLPDSPVVEMPDGSNHAFYIDKNDPSRFISRDFWVYKKISGGSGYGIWELTLTDGTIYTFEYGTGKAGYNTFDDFNNKIEGYAQVTKIRNAAGTASINITYYKDNNRISYLKTITDSANRLVTFNYDHAKNQLSSITVDGRTFRYGYTTINGHNHLTSFSPPVGNPWTYGYEAANELNSITYPTGGRIAYGYSDVSFATGVATARVNFRVVTGRTTYKHGGAQEGTWSYTYSAPSLGSNVTTINAPGVTETHTFYGWGNTGNGTVWKVGLPMSKSYSGAFSLTESYTWTQSPSISLDDISNAGWNGTVGWIYDSSIYVPLLSSKTVTRDGKSYATTFSEFNSYGDPQLISEVGDGSRNRSIDYWTSSAKNIVKGKPVSESVTGTFSGSSSSSWVYDSNSGNVTSAIKDGVATGYGYDAKGNLSSVTDANNNITRYLWTNGEISRETNSYYSISRVIEPSGTIGSETNGRLKTTSFTYDGNLRPTSKKPPTGNLTSISYPADSSYRKEARGGYFITYSFDGFGRPTGSSDSRGIMTSIGYTPYGIKEYEDSSVGDKIYYDYFGRVTRIEHKDKTAVRYAYDGSNVNITDENNGTSVMTYNSFGDPDERYLLSVRDQDYNLTSYARNIQGNLLKITQGPSPATLDMTLSKRTSWSRKQTRRRGTSPMVATVLET